MITKNSFSALLIPGLLAMALMATSCRTAQEALSPNAPILGAWDYVVSGTPEGDVGGTINILESDAGLNGTMTMALVSGSVTMKDLAFDGTTLTFAATFDLDGQILDTKTTAQIEGETITGNIDVPGFGTFPVKGSRKVTL